MITETARWPTVKAYELAAELERRGSIEGHYVWAKMIQQALDVAFSEGFQKGQTYDK